MTADTILNLLAAKHSKDVFIPECKDGPTGFTGCLRMDAWVMRGTWTELVFTAYEVKVSRSDFRQDDKWRHYLPNCNRFFFVCPSGLIQPEELEAEVGLLWVTKTENGLREKKRAHFRDIEFPQEVVRYVMMWRCGCDIAIGPQTGDLSLKVERLERTNAILNERLDCLDHAQNVSKTLGRGFKTKVGAAVKALQSLQFDLHRVEEQVRREKEKNDERIETETTDSIPVCNDPGSSDV